MNCSQEFPVFSIFLGDSKTMSLAAFYANYGGPLDLTACSEIVISLPNQDGAPVRVVVPWKYGFKSAKSIVKVRFLAKQPPTTWNDMAPQEYGFYSNVNPSVDHPRWSQKRERRLGSGFLPKIIDTMPFNGYADQVASLYNGMDLRKNF